MVHTYSPVPGHDRACLDCPRGWHTNNFNKSSACIVCGEGQFGNGKQLGCVLCGNATSRLAHFDPAYCPACSPGLFNPLLGQGVCLMCAAGKFQEKSGQSSCKLCPAGFSRAEFVSLEETPDVDSTRCDPCRAGDTTLEVGLSRCEGCQVGKYGYTRATGPEKYGGFCFDCPSGWYLDSKGKTNCQPCPAETYLETNGSAALGDCKLCSSTYAPHTTTSGTTTTSGRTAPGGEAATIT